MPKITFMGAGSTIFAKNILGDCLLTPALQQACIALYDIDETRLAESEAVIQALNASLNQGRATISTHLGVPNRREALDDASYVINAIQVGGYDPCTITDFDIPKRFGLRQTIADTIGIGGIFRTLRTLPIMLDFTRDMEAVCPDAWFLNYTNPMCTLTGGLLRYSPIKTVGLCHSVQICASSLIDTLGWQDRKLRPIAKIAGINHMAWMLEFTDENGNDLYPEAMQRAGELLQDWRRPEDKKSANMVRLEMMLQFGYYITESSEHLAEYVPYFIKSRAPHLIEEYNIPLDEYPRRCIDQIESWKKRSVELLSSPTIEHERTQEYGSYIIEAIETGTPFEFGGNVLNDGLITNLPANAVVEVPCIADKAGIRGIPMGDLPEQCAALNRSNINTQLLTLEAHRTQNRRQIYQAAMLDPHTAAELTLDEIRHLCDALIDAHGDWLPPFTY
jgi:alpha-galactosidase